MGVPFNVLIMRSRASLMVPVWLLALCAAVAWFGLACGGGGEDGDLVFDFSDLEDEPQAQSGPRPTRDPFARLSQRPKREMRLDYLHDIWAMLRQLETSRRSMFRHVEDAQSERVKLNWVVDAHNLHRRSEEFRIRAYSYPVPERLAGDYLDFHVAFLEAVQMYSHSADRLLAAAIVIGPSGRGSSDLLPAETAQYVSLLGESAYYSLDTEVLTSRLQDDLKEIFKSLRVR